MKNIFILSVFAILFFMANTAQAQDYFKERRYEGIDFTKLNARKYYVTISRKKYELVDKEEGSFLGQKISFDKKQELFFIKRQKKAMTFRETINFMEHVGNEQSAKALKGSLNLYRANYVSQALGSVTIIAGVLMLTTWTNDGENQVGEGFIAIGSGAAFYGGGYLLKRKAEKNIMRTLRYHNKNVRKFSTPAIATTNFIPSNLGFKPVRTNLLNPTPVPTLSLSWSF